MYSKNDIQKHRLTIIKLFGWALLLSGISMLYFSLVQLTSTAHAASTPINALVCSGGNHSPAIIDKNPTDAMIVTQKNITLEIIADWVTTITVKRGNTTLATASGANQPNQTFSLPLALNEGDNTLSIHIQGGCPVDSAVESYHLTYVKNAANVVAKSTSMLSPRLTGFYQPMGVRVFVEINGRVYEAITHSDMTWELPAGEITPDLEEGSYDIRVYTQDSSGTILFDETYHDALSIDLTAPSVSLNKPFSFTNRSPELSGTTNDPTATITVSINNHAYTAINNRDGTWTLPKGAIEKLSNGDYVVLITAVDASGNKTSIQKTIHIKAANQVGFVLAPNTGYLRIGDTNIRSPYVYLVLISCAVVLIGTLAAAIRALRRKATASR